MSGGKNAISHRAKGKQFLDLLHPTWIGLWNPRRRIRNTLFGRNISLFQNIPLAGSILKVNASQPTLFFAVHTKRAKSSSPVYWTIKMLTLQERLKPELTRSEFLCQVNIGWGFPSASHVSLTSVPFLTVMEMTFVFERMLGASKIGTNKIPKKLSAVETNPSPSKA